jgi:uncharacterized integral membrane protein
MRSLGTWLIGIPLLVIVAAFAIANRDLVWVGVDPFAPDTAGLRVPLFLVAFFFLLLGILIGGAAAWIRQGKWRRLARHQAQEKAALEQRLRALEARETEARAYTAELARPPELP